TNVVHEVSAENSMASERGNVIGLSRISGRCENQCLKIHEDAHPVTVCVPTNKRYSVRITVGVPEQVSISISGTVLPGFIDNQRIPACGNEAVFCHPGNVIGDVGFGCRAASAGLGEVGV